MRIKDNRMTVYRFRGMDKSGDEVSGYMDAQSEEEAMGALRKQRWFVTNLAAFVPVVTPEWAGTSLASPNRILSGRLLAEGLPCTHEQRGLKSEGSLNLFGVGGELHLILDRPGGGGPVLELPVQKINEAKRRGLFRKSLVVTTDTFEEHVFHGPVNEIQGLYEWALFATEEVTEANK
jgi:hypothetical protein